MTADASGALVIATGAIGFAGIMLGYYGIKDDLDGVVTGFVIAVILSYLLRGPLLGVVSSL